MDMATVVAMKTMAAVTATKLDMAEVVTALATAAIGMVLVRVNMAAVTIDVDHSSHLDVQHEGMPLVNNGTT